MQQGQPVTYASRALTKVEQNYLQIEKELLAQVFSMEHKHQYVYSRGVTLSTDHKPLEMVVKKPLAAAPKCLQHLMMRLMQYDVEIKYRRGPEMYLVDTLSRAYLPHEHHPGKADQEVERIHSVNFLSVSKPQIQEICEETAKDAILQSMKAVILNGWPTISVISRWPTHTPFPPFNVGKHNLSELLAKVLLRSVNNIEQVGAGGWLK